MCIVLLRPPNVCHLTWYTQCRLYYFVHLMFVILLCGIELHPTFAPPESEDNGTMDGDGGTMDGNGGTMDVQARRAPHQCYAPLGYYTIIYDNIE